MGLQLNMDQKMVLKIVKKYDQKCIKIEYCTYVIGWFKMSQNLKIDFFMI